MQCIIMIGGIMTGCGKYLVIWYVISSSTLHPTSKITTAQSLITETY